MNTQELAWHLSVSPDRKGEHHIDCPFCGMEAMYHNSPKFSFSSNGYHCFACDAGGSLKNLAEHMRVESRESFIQPVPIKRQPKPIPERPKWLGIDRDTYLRCWQQDIEQAFSQWQNYKKLSLRTIQRYCLGYGRLPKPSKCPHNRLIVPIFNNGKLACIRGREIDCNCGKWLVSGGFRVDDLPLYNSWLIEKNDIVVICENPIDALMVKDNLAIARKVIDQMPNRIASSLAEKGTDFALVGVATLSVSYWCDGWLEPLRKASMVAVAYDNDLPGNGGGQNREKFIEQWKKEKGTNKTPRPMGLELANKLRKGRIPHVVFDWGNSPNKLDIGEFLNE